MADIQQLTTPAIDLQRTVDAVWAPSFGPLVTENPDLKWVPGADNKLPESYLQERAYYQKHFPGENPAHQTTPEPSRQSELKLIQSGRELMERIEQRAQGQSRAIGRDL